MAGMYTEEERKRKQKRQDLHLALATPYTTEEEWKRRKKHMDQVMAGEPDIAWVAMERQRLRVAKTLPHWMTNPGGVRQAPTSTSSSSSILILTWRCKNCDDTNPNFKKFCETCGEPSADAKDGDKGWDSGGDKNGDKGCDEAGEKPGLKDAKF